MRILVDPGHGGKFTGAVANGVQEKDLTLRVSYKLLEELETHGSSCSLTRTKDMNFFDEVGRDLMERCLIEQMVQPDLFISIHANCFHDPAAHGFEVWTSPGQTESDVYADAILAAVKQAFPERTYRTDMTDGDFDKEDHFKVLTGTRGPAVLVELGFISNQEELCWMLDENNQRILAQAICRAVLGVESKAA